MTTCLLVDIGGLPDRDRTCDPQLRRLMLYPTELRADVKYALQSLDVQKAHQGELFVRFLVGVQGFEPWTPWSQTRCATRLRHTPTSLTL